MVILFREFSNHPMYILTYRNTGMQKGEKDLQRISLADGGHMLITLESHGIFRSILSRHWYAKQ